MRFLSSSTGAPPALSPCTSTWNPALDDALCRVAGTDAAFAALHAPGALVVTTGQQPGLFTGPVYTIHKALAAAALARELTARWQRPVVPIFWLAGDDHDFAEASTASWLDGDAKLREWHLPARDPSAPQRSMAREPLPPEIVEGLDLLEATLPAGPDRDMTIAWLRRRYRPGVTLHAAYAESLAELLAPYGVLCLDATHSAFKRAQVPLLREALTRASELDAALAALPPTESGIAAGDGATLVFLETDLGRDRLIVDGDGFAGRRTGTTYSREEAFALLERAPEQWSANVLLRPVVEAALLPTVAYVAGPGEYRYLTQQAFALYPLLGVTPQRPVPRWSATLVDDWADRVLERLGVSAEALLHDDGTMGRQILRRDLPADVPIALDALRKAVDHASATLTRAGHEIDAVLDRAVQSRDRRLRAVTDDLERLFERHLRKRSDIAYAQYRRLRDALRPGEGPQERLLGAPSFLARFGHGWTDAVAEATRAWAGTLERGEGGR